MAYETQYRIAFTNELNQEIIILLQEKDGTVPVSVQEYAATSITLTKQSEDQDKFSTITYSELSMTFDMRATDINYWDDFVNAEGDTWKVIATLDTKYIFHGFVIPDEGAVPFQDRPYDATIKATDQLAFLKQRPLVDFNGINFEGEYTTISYIGCALFRTGLDLEIRVYDNFFHTSMNTRAADLKWDFVSQTMLEARTFQKDPITFVSCWEALEIICKRGFKIFYQEGQWFIVRLGMFQFNPSPKYYTVYSSNLLSKVGFEDQNNYTLVGKHDIIYCINEDQIKTVKFANKSVKTLFNYNVWPEIPKNNKFERGALIPLYSGPGYASYEIDDWTFGGFTGGADTSALPSLNATTKRAYRKSFYNAFNIEIDRNIILEQTIGDNNSVLLSEGIPVIAGDKIKISFDRKLSYSGVGTSQIGLMWLQADNGNRYFITNQNTSQMTPFYWVRNTASRVTKSYTTGENFNEWTSFDITPPEIPFNGSFYIGLVTTGVTNSTASFKNFSVEYLPFVAGGYIQVKADYWIRSQNKNYPDISDEEVFISDNEHKVFKGSILKLSDGKPTTQSWYRDGVTEIRHYKELINIAEYNMLYRRFWQIEGSFNGLTYSPENNTIEFFPLSLHCVYKFTDITPEERYFMLNTPVEQDLITGHFRGTFIELNMVPPGAAEIVESLETFIFRVIAAINSTSDAEWDEFGGAPAPGTVAYPPSAYLWTGIPNTIAVAINDADNMTKSVSDGGAGNSPSVTEIYNADIGPYRFIQYTFGTDIAIGNVFTFSAYGHDVVITVEGSTVLASADGNQLGDSSSFNYIF